MPTKILTTFVAGVIVAAMLTAANAPRSEEEQERLAQERAYQQELAKKRAEEAKERAAFEERNRNASAEEKYSRLIERAEQFLDRAEFQAGVRAYNQAMTVKPPDLAVTERVRELQSALQAQNQPVEVTLTSDGETWVSIRNYRAPAKLASLAVRMLPGDYEVRGARKGFQDVVMQLQVRAGAPPSEVSVVCTRPASPR